MEPELAVVVPTYNERENVALLAGRLADVLEGIEWEAVFVDDDSPDGTAAAVEEVRARDPRVRCLRRVGERGLASACLAGMAATTAPFIAVMDADFQHDEALLPAMLARLRGEDAAGPPVDIVVASRYLAGGGVGEWGRARHGASRLATVLGRLATGHALSDPLSGFFMLRREVFEGLRGRLRGRGFKILLEIVAAAPAPLRCAELPYDFRTRRAGTSKLGPAAVAAFLATLLRAGLRRRLAGARPRPVPSRRARPPGPRAPSRRPPRP